MEKHSEDSEDSRDPLLRQSIEESNIRLHDPTSDHNDKRQSIRLWLRSNALLVAIFSLLLYIAIMLTINVTMKFGQQPPRQMFNDRPNLVRDIIQYEERREWYPPESPWDMGPSDELDTAWNTLLQAIDIRVSSDELDTLGINKTNRVQVNGGDYLGSMGVYHHLHCLNNLRMVVHWDYYEPKFADSPYRDHLDTPHSDHCINSLRQAVMCHANTDISTFEWVDEETPLHGKEQRMDAVSTCTKWDSLDNWVRQRRLVPGKFTYRPGPFTPKEPKSKDIE
ncbi:hypothetical protein F4677DRAFT_274637 [Hypoxylon crocopeplum]|nr:hypothetical protein F4677DRAFT_274637 [Hypoxylon crocopeplum]